MDAVLDELLDAVYDGRYTSDDLMETLAKMSPTGADLHADGDPGKRKKVAGAALAGTTLATVGGLHALAGTRAEHKLRAKEIAEGKKDVPKALRRLGPKKAALVATGAWAGLHTAELASDAVNAHTQASAYRKASADQKAQAPKRTKVAAAAPRDGAFVKVATAEEIGKGLRGLRQTADLGGMLHDTKLLEHQQAEMKPGGRLDPNERLHVYRNGQKHYHDENGVPYETRGEHRARIAAQDKDFKRTDRKVKAYDTVVNAQDAADRLKAHPVVGGHVQAAMDAVSQAARGGPPKPATVGDKLRAHPLATGAGAAAAGVVAGGANERRKNQYGLAKAADIEFRTEITKVDPDKRLVFGYCSLSKVNGQPVVDLQGDYIPIDEIEKSAYAYTLNSRKGGVMHRRDGANPVHVADLVESFVVTPEKLEKMGLPEDALPHGWWTGFKVTDDATWADVKAGRFTGFSIHGSGIRKDAVL